MALAGGDHAHHGGGRKADDRRQPVHAVDQIQGVDAADQPEDRQRNAQPAQLDRAAEGHDAIDVVAQQHDRQHGDDLQGQLDAGGQVEAVVDAADKADEAGGDASMRWTSSVKLAACRAAPKRTASRPSTVAA